MGVGKQEQIRMTMRQKLFLILIALALSIPAVAQETMIVRLAEIEVYPEHLKEYLEYANEVDRLSVEREPGVVCLFPMQSAEDSTQIRILEIYASEKAYPKANVQQGFSMYGHDVRTGKERVEKWLKKLGYQGK